MPAITTGADALAALQHKNPKAWEKDIQNAISKIKGWCRTWAIADPTEAYNTFLRKFGRPHDAQAIMAALHFMNSRTRMSLELQKLHLRAQSIEESLEKLAGRQWPEATKTGIAAFYNRRLAKLTADMAEIVNNMPVLGAINA